MKCAQYYPVLQTQDVSGTAAFYQRHFRFKAAFDSDWYVHLQSVEDPAVNLAVLQADHDTIPAMARGVTTGLIINFEVDDVDAVYDQARSAGLPSSARSSTRGSSASDGAAAPSLSARA